MARKRPLAPDICDRTLMRYVVDRMICVDRLAEDFRNRRLPGIRKRDAVTQQGKAASIA